MMEKMGGCVDGTLIVSKRKALSLTFLIGFLKAEQAEKSRNHNFYTHTFIIYSRVIIVQFTDFSETKHVTWIHLDGRFQRSIEKEVIVVF
jgi:hypothetical protein